MQEIERNENDYSMAYSIWLSSGKLWP